MKINIQYTKCIPQTKNRAKFFQSIELVVETLGSFYRHLFACAFQILLLYIDLIGQNQTERHVSAGKETKKPFLCHIFVKHDKFGIEHQMKSYKTPCQTALLLFNY